MLALDTSVLVHWANADAAHHRAVRDLIHTEAKEGRQLALVPQVCWEFLHVSTDPRRFPRPLTMTEAIGRVRAWWDAPETRRVAPGGGVLHRTLELMERHDLGRKRILDTALAATLKGAGIRRLATLDGRGFQAFPFIEVVDPR